MNTEFNLKNHTENYESEINETYNKLIDNIQNWCNITNEQAAKLWFDIQTFVEDTYKPNKSVDEYVKELQNILFCTINPAWIKIAIDNINEYNLIDETIEEDTTIKPIIKFEYNKIIFSYVGPDKQGC